MVINNNKHILVMFMGQFSVSRQILNFIIIIKVSAQVIIKFQKFDKIKNNLIYAKIVHVLWYSSPVFLKYYSQPTS
jgi:RNA-binding protein YlmH